MAADELLSSMDLPLALRDRILCRVPPPSSSDGALPSEDGSKEIACCKSSSERKQPSFVLYLPTVVLRKRHNPAFAFACRLANLHAVPVVVLCTVLDDQHLSNPPPLSPVVMTARRLAFTMEALQSACQQWEDHGAGVAVRVHGPPNCRTPHHLSLCHKACAVISEPYRTYVNRVATTCRAAGGVPFFTLDGSTSVPPRSVLLQRGGSDHDDDVSFAPAPVKAWRWEKQTNPFRKSHVYSVYRDGALDAPVLSNPLPRNFFLSLLPPSTAEATKSDDYDDDNNNNKNNTNDGRSSEALSAIMHLLPSNWSNPDTPCPGHRPWTVQELAAIQDCKQWAMTLWEGADTSVPPCRQTHGSAQAAQLRWRCFLQSGGLKHYAQRRNQVASPHAVSRISCYLNMGILSIFDVLHDVYHTRSSCDKSGGPKSSKRSGCDKFLDEVVKFREGSYAHAFASPTNYRSVEVLPAWARRDLEGMMMKVTAATATATASRPPPSFSAGDHAGGHEYVTLETASTGDEVWDAMQRYLIETGELHNHARMTWGKTVVHWQARRLPPAEVLHQLCCLNDRFALDGLSPPSYGGILWCLGWNDRPADGGRVSTKWAHRYRGGAAAFQQAKERLYDANPYVGNGSESGDGPAPTAKRARQDDGNTVETKPLYSPCSPGSNSSGKANSSILTFFSPVPKEGKA